MIPCETARALLDEALDRPLVDGESEVLAAHLASCPACREEAAALGAVDGALRGMAAPDPGDAFSDRVVAALDRAPGGSAPPVPAGTRILRALVAAAGTAAFVGLCVALLPLRATASTVGSLVPEIPAPPIPDVLAGISGIVPPCAAAAGALLAAAGAALAVAALRRRGSRP